MRLFPFGDTVISTRATSTDTDSLAERDAEGDTVEEQDEEQTQRGVQGGGVTAQV